MPLAAECLRDFGAHERFDARALAAWLATGELGRQYDPGNTFGDPPVTLFTNSDFRVEVYFWNDTHTTIHDHRFAGAFTVLEGRSLHTTFAFDLDREVVEGLRIGDLSRTKAEVFEKGAVQEVPGGPPFIHQVVHLERPTATLMIRNHLEFHLLHQYRYWRPEVASATTLRDDALDKRLALLGFMRKAGLPAREVAQELVRKQNPYQVFRTLYAYWQLFRDPEHLDDLLVAATKAHGGWVAPVAKVFADAEERHDIAWSQISDPDATLLACLLSNGLGAEEISAFFSASRLDAARRTLGESKTGAEGLLLEA